MASAAGIWMKRERSDPPYSSTNGRSAVLREPVGEHAARGARADDHVVESLIAHRSAPPLRFAFHASVWARRSKRRQAGCLSGADRKIWFRSARGPGSTLARPGGPAALSSVSQLGKSSAKELAASRLGNRASSPNRICERLGNALQPWNCSKRLGLASRQRRSGVPPGATPDKAMTDRQPSSDRKVCAT